MDKAHKAYSECEVAYSSSCHFAVSIIDSGDTYFIGYFPIDLSGLIWSDSGPCAWCAAVAVHNWEVLNIVLHTCCFLPLSKVTFSQQLHSKKFSVLQKWLQPSVFYDCVVQTGSGFIFGISYPSELNRLEGNGVTVLVWMNLMLVINNTYAFHALCSFRPVSPLISMLYRSPKIHIN